MFQPAEFSQTLLSVLPLIKLFLYFIFLPLELQLSLFDYLSKVFTFERLSFVVTKVLPAWKTWTFLNENKNVLVGLFLTV